jgi:uncharacterized membrane protein YbaN (DUF454 family)
MTRRRTDPAPEPAGTQAAVLGLIVHYAPFDGANAEGELHSAPSVNDASEHEVVRGESMASTGDPVAIGLTKLANLAAAGGCFLLSIVGFILPGIPTIPFVLATSYFLARSTPEWNDWLRRSWCFGQFVRDWEDSGGLRRRTKFQTVAFMFVLIGVTLPTVNSLPMIAMTATVAIIDLWAVLRLPTIPDETPPTALLGAS